MHRYSSPRKGKFNFNSVLFCIQLGLVISLVLTFVILVYVSSLAITHRKYVQQHAVPNGAIRHSVNGHVFDVYNFSKPCGNTGPHFQQGISIPTYYYLRKSYNLSSALIGQWVNEREEFCGGKFVGHANLFARLANVVIDPAHGTGRIGGEIIDEVIGQTEEMEYFTLSPGYFNIMCKSGNVSYFLKANDHLYHWAKAVKCHKHINYKVPTTIRKVTIAIQRYEYANLYHTMTDYYNTFLKLLIYNIRPGNANIMWIDGHPNGNLDSTWGTLFGHVIRAGDLTTPTFFKTLIWNILGYNSPLMQHYQDNVPYLEEFRHFFLKRHNVHVYRQLDCNNVTFTFLWRRDYLAHPRNPTGTIVRKIKNEDELAQTLQREFPHSHVQGLQIDQYPMKDQLQFITNTDLLIGMHGAGLTHALFLQDYAGLIELFPHESPALHFQSIARWRGLRYAHWSNKNTAATQNGYTTVPADVIVAMTKEIINSTCPSQPKEVVLDTT